MFKIQNELNGYGFRVLCNDISVVSGIPSQTLASRVVTELKKEDWIDWNTFPLGLYMPEQLAIGSIVEKICLTSEAD